MQHAAQKIIREKHFFGVRKVKFEDSRDKSSKRNGRWKVLREHSHHHSVPTAATAFNCILR